MLRYAIISTLLYVLPFYVMSQASVAQRALPKLSLQLHSVKNEVTENFKDTLTKIAEMGFVGVEFAGRYGPFKDDPKGLKAFLQSIGLQASGAHIPLSQLQGELGASNFEFLKQLEVGLIIIPHEKRIDDPKKIDELIKELTVASERANQFGLKLGYHNHAKEFNTFNDATFWDYLAQHTPTSFFLQLDVGWANYANVDPIEYVKRYPNRTLTSHFKIRTYQGKPGQVSNDKKVILGEDNYQWASLLNVMTEYGGTRWIVVEQEEYPENMTPLNAVSASMKGLQNIIQDLSIDKETILKSNSISNIENR